MSCQQTTELSPELQNVFNSFMHEAVSISGHSLDFIPPHEISWFDPILLQEGMDFVQRHQFSVHMSNFVGGLWSLAAKNLGGESLYRRGSVTTPEKSFLRILSTLRRFVQWYETNIGDENSEGFKSLKTVRKLHQIYGEPKVKHPVPEPWFEAEFTDYTRQLVTLVREDIALQEIDTTFAPDFLLQPKTSSDALVFSQFTLGLTQMSMIVPLMLFPEMVGLNFDDDSGIKGYYHLMAVVGRSFGLEDRFNLALIPDKTLHHKILKNTFVASWQQTEETGIHLGEIFVEGVNQKLPSAINIQVELVLFLVFGCMGVVSQEVWRRLNFVNKFYWQTYAFTCWCSKTSSLARCVINCVWGFILWMFISLFIKSARKKEGNVGCPF